MGEPRGERFPLRTLNLFKGTVAVDEQNGWIRIEDVDPQVIDQTTYLGAYRHPDIGTWHGVVHRYGSGWVDGLGRSIDESSHLQFVHPIPDIPENLLSRVLNGFEEGVE